MYVADPSIFRGILLTIIVAPSLLALKGAVKIYRVPRPGFGKNLPEKKSSPPFCQLKKKSSPP